MDCEQTESFLGDFYEDSAPQNPRLREALRLLREAYDAMASDEYAFSSIMIDLVSHGTRDCSEVSRSAELYAESLKWFPTSEGFTYLAWMRSMQVCCVVRGPLE